jgi:hypothetical protein
LQGVLAQAKNDDELFFAKRNFMQPMGRPKHVVLLFLTFKFGEVFYFFSFFPGSQCVPTIFPLSSQWVLVMFHLNSQWVPIRFPQHFLHSTSLLSHMLCQMLSSFCLYTWAKGEKLYISKNSTFYFRGASIVSLLFE